MTPDVRFTQSIVAAPRRFLLACAAHWRLARGVIDALRTLLLLSCLGPLPAARADPAADAKPAAVSWVESDFPFYSSVLDARKAGAAFPENNLTPRGLIIPAGENQWVCFDVDLLRVSAVWRGAGITPIALAPGSYHAPDRKTSPGQNRLPRPDGQVWLANGIYPGWQLGDAVSLEDPREPAPTVTEVGRGPLPGKLGRFRAVHILKDSVVLDYEVGGATVQEWITGSPSSTNLERHFRIAPSSHPMVLVVGVKRPGSGAPAIRADASAGVALLDHSSVWAVRVLPHNSATAFSVAMAATGEAAVPAAGFPRVEHRTRWPQEISTQVHRSAASDAYVVDEVALPVDNPWRRDVRLSDIQFLSDGTGVGVTIDGDVWLARGLAQEGGAVRWRRFASGLHEPMTVAIRDDAIFAFDRNGIWKLLDTDADGEADVHELFSNVFAQTADMREFPNTIRLAPHGEFVIAKGGQEATTLGKHNGSVLRISADGERFELLGYGFRQPNIGVNEKTGLVTASDQQGHYVPSTPIHIVRDAQFYGFLSGLRPKEKYPAPIADPLTWIPHAMNPSGISQTWLHGAKMGPLNDALIHISFNQPEIFRVLLNSREETLQAAVVSVTNAFDFAPLNGSVNPADGQLYVAGFQVFGWGTTAKRVSGLGRVRFTGAESLTPNSVVPMDKGVLLGFDVPIDPDSANSPDNFEVSSWHYQRTPKYGSPQFKADGTPGVDKLVATRAYVSKDGRSVFLAVPEMKPVMQLQVDWKLRTASGTAMEGRACLTPYELSAFDPEQEGFGDITIDLTPRTAAAPAKKAAINAESGRLVAQQMGCIACHSTVDPKVTTPGPSWIGLFGSARKLTTGAVVTADEAYLREAILNPAAKVAAAYGNGEFAMPSYAGVLSAEQIESVILYIKELRPATK